MASVSKTAAIEPSFTILSCCLFLWRRGIDRFKGCQGNLASLIFVASLVLTWCNKHGKTRDLETVCYSLAGDPDSDHKVKHLLTNHLETLSLGYLSETARES